MFRLAALLVVLITLWPTSAHAQDADYGVRIPSKVQGCYAPVGSRLIGSHEKDHIDRGSVNAWDWSATVGSPVWAICPGVVNYAGCNNSGGYGCWVRIDHGSGYESSTAHCMEGSVRVRAGDRVDATTQVCNVGMTGMTSWPHVHLVIKYQGVHQLISTFFDASLIHYCHFTRCKATNDPQAPVTMGGMIQAAQQGGTQTTIGEARIYTLLRSLSGIKPEALISAYFVFFLSIGFLLWLGSNLVRMVVIGILTGAATALVIVWLFMPPLATVTAAAAQRVGGGDAFEAALAVTLKREGAGCDNYIVRTLHGVTQWTYDRYRREKGLSKADVCTSLTEAEERYIYYTYYWLPSGANQLPVNAAIPVFDHYVNAGRKISECGSDVRCINRQRLQFYLGTNDCARRTKVCQAWLDRVEYIRKLTEGS